MTFRAHPRSWFTPARSGRPACRITPDACGPDAKLGPCLTQRGACGLVTRERRVRDIDVRELGACRSDRGVDPPRGRIRQIELAKSGQAPEIVGGVGREAERVGEGVLAHGLDEFRPEF